jgi:hypothetical protein
MPFFLLTISLLLSTESRLEPKPKHVASHKLITVVVIDGLYFIFAVRISQGDVIPKEVDNGERDTSVDP